MTWFAPIKAVVPHRMFGWSGTRTKDRHRPGYSKDYYWRNVEKRRAYLAKWSRENRKSRAKNRRNGVPQTPRTANHKRRTGGVHINGYKQDTQKH